MNHVKLTKEEIEASIAAANDKLNHMQMKQRAENSYAMGLDAIRQIQNHQPLSLLQMAQTSMHTSDLYRSSSMFFWYLSDLGKKQHPNHLELAKQEWLKIGQATVQLQHLLGDIVHERTHS